MYAILRAAFMSDEPVRGAPSIDAFSVEKVENEAWSVRQFLVFLLILHPSQILSLSFFFAYFLPAGPHSKAHATRREIQFARVPLGRQFMICQ